MAYIFGKKCLMDFSDLPYVNIEVESAIKTIREVMTTKFVLKFVLCLCKRRGRYTKSIYAVWNDESWFVKIEDSIFYFWNVRFIRKIIWQWWKIFG